MSRAGSERIGSIEWTERTGGILSPRERVALAGPLLRGHRGIVLGSMALALRVHSGRRNSISPTSLELPDSTLSRDAEEAAQDLLSPALLNHSRRAFVWGSALADIDGVKFDRELFYVACLFHDTGIPSPVRDVDFTVRSAALLREFAEGHNVDPTAREVMTNAIALHHTPGVDLGAGPEAYLLSAGAAVDVFGLRSGHLPDAVRREIVQKYPRLGFKREFTGLFRTEARRVPHGRAWYLHRFAFSDVTMRLAPFRG